MLRERRVIAYVWWWGSRDSLGNQVGVGPEKFGNHLSKRWNYDMGRETHSEFLGSREGLDIVHWFILSLPGLAALSKHE